MAKVRVYELAKEFGVESKVVMAKLQELGEFVRSASSTIEAPVVRKLKEAFPAGAPPSDGAGPAQPATKKAAAKRTTAKKAAAQPETPLAEQVAAAEGLRLRGVMAVAPLGVDPQPGFAKLAEIAERVRLIDPGATWVSAGMSGDFEAAVVSGATHVRIGSAVLGSRPPRR